MHSVDIRPQGVCSMSFHVEYDDNRVITKAEHVGGCKGNLDGICRLIVGMKVDEVVNKLSGVLCRNGTSCPDQLARGLKEKAI